MDTTVSIIAVLAILILARIFVRSRVRLRELEKSLPEPVPSPWDLHTTRNDGLQVSFSAERTSDVAKLGLEHWLRASIYLNRFEGLVSRQRDVLVTLKRSQTDLAAAELAALRAKDQVEAHHAQRAATADLEELRLRRDKLKLEVEIRQMSEDLGRESRLREARLTSEILLLEAQTKAATTPVEPIPVDPAVPPDEAARNAEFKAVEQTFDHHVRLREHVARRRHEIEERLGPAAARDLVDQAAVSSGIFTPTDPEHAGWATDAAAIRPGGGS